MTLLLHQLPQFTITRVSADDGLSYVGTLTTLAGIGEGYAYLYAGDLWIEGKLNELDASSCTAVFHPSNPDEATQFVVGHTYPYLDGYWGERAQLVFDRAKRWQRIQFAPSDATRFSRDGQQEVLPGGWDHEHCSICWETISEASQAYGYRDDQDTWICARCYLHYVVPRSLSFIEA